MGGESVSNTEYDLLLVGRDSYLHLLSDLGLLDLLFILPVDVDGFLTDDLGLFDGELFVGLDLNLASLLNCFLFDESHLKACGKEKRGEHYAHKAARIRMTDLPTIFFISERTSSSFIGRLDMMYMFRFLTAGYCFL